MHLGDGFGRTFKYLRLSLTEVCNFRCSYCLPDGYKKSVGPSALSIDEIVRAGRAFSELGLSKIRLTGGEPTIRADFTDIVSALSELPHVDTLALTTNGYRLGKLARDWHAAGIRAINVSLDSLDPSTFHSITGHDRCLDVRRGIEEALSIGFETVKVNVVYMKGINDHEVDDFVDMTRKLPLSIRFIELMETGDHAEFFRDHHLPVETITKNLRRNGWAPKLKMGNAGPSQDYIHPGYAGSIGVIAPYAKDFCKACNRLRFSSLGNLHLCLFGAFGVPLRPLLQRDEQLAELKERIVLSVKGKTAHHQLHVGDTGATSNLSAIGG